MQDDYEKHFFCLTEKTRRHHGGTIDKINRIVYNKINDFFTEELSCETGSRSYGL